MYIFKFRIDLGGMDDSLYLTNPPNQEDLIQGFKENQKLAGVEWSEWYDEILSLIPKINWSEARPNKTGRLTVISRFFKDEIPSVHRGYSFSRHEVIPNKPKD